jgi:hypothetical protein
MEKLTHLPTTAQFARTVADARGYENPFEAPHPFNTLASHYELRNSLRTLPSNQTSAGNPVMPKNTGFALASGNSSNAFGPNRVNWSFAPSR